MSDLRYTLSLPRPESHLFHVTLEVRDPGPGPLDLVMPAWAPGSYKIRDYARHVQDFSAGGLPWRKVDKSRWRVETRGTKAVRIQYRVWAFELTVRTSHLDGDHGYANGASLFVYVDGRKDAPVRLAIRAPKGWRVATGLDPAGPNEFRAPDYDALVDCPIEIGRFRDLKFRARGRPHRIAIHGAGNYDERAIVRDVAKIVETEARMMGGLPYRHYTFLLHTAQDGGGLEHRNSCSLQYPPFHFRPREKYENFLELVAHEFFHLWNVKRIRPEPLGPFDYEREVYTTLLWVMEGLTSYYDTLIPARAGLWSATRYLRKIAERIQKYEEKPGRRRQSLAQSSFNTWINLYQPNENFPNAQMSYYEKGGLVGLCLDLEIRRRAGNRKSLDDVMRRLYGEVTRTGRGFPEDGFRRACERIAGGNLDRFWADLVDGTAEIDWGGFLDAAGLELAREARKGEDGKIEKAKPWIGVAMQRLSVTSVTEGSPADLAGLSPKDELVAVGGARVDPETWERRIEERRPGDRLRLHVFRAGFLREIEVRIGSKANLVCSIRKRKRATALQRRTYEGWLGSSWKR